MSNINTPYDDAFHTLLINCKRLIIPVVNLIFGEQHSLNDKVSIFHNELYITEGADKKRVTDSNFSFNENIKRYHVECQANPDSTITIRVFEYASQVAITTAESNSNSTIFRLPQSGIIYLRSNKNTPLSHTIVVEAPNGKTIEYEVPAIKIKDFNFDTMIEQNLWFLIPFNFFNYEFLKEEKYQDKIPNMQAEYQNLWNRLEVAVKNREISAYEYSAIKAMCDKVASNVAEGSEILKKGVNKVMGGQLVDFEGRRIAINSAIDALLNNKVSSQKIIIYLKETYGLSDEESITAIENVEKLQTASA